MGRNKYFLLITSDISTSTSLLKKCYSSSMESLEYLKTSVPTPCLKLLNNDINIMQLVFSSDKELADKSAFDVQWVCNPDNDPIRQFKSTQDIATMLHKISESLPHLGSYDITIFCEGSLFYSKPECHWELFSALLRLSHWSMADIVCLSSETESNLGPNWDKVIRIDKDFKNAKDITLWKGNIIVKAGFWFTKFKLVFDTEEKWNEFPVNASEVANTDNSMPFCVSHRLELLQECNKLTIPSYLIYPTKLKLKPFHAKGKENEQSPFVKYMRDKLEIGVLARVKYYPVEDAMDKLELTSKLWNEALLNDKYKDCLNDKCLPSSTASYINILIFGNNETEEDVLSCFILRNPAEMNTTFLEAVLAPSILPAHQEDIDIASKMFATMPKFAPRHWKDLEDEITRIKKKNNDEMTVDQRILKNFKFCLVQQSKPQDEYLTKFKALSCQNNSYDLDPCDWPERKFLAANIRVEDPQATLKAKSCQSSVSSLEIMKLFDQDGRAKKKPSTNTSPIKPLNGISKFRAEDFEKLIMLRWPDIKNYHYHDIYYNDDNTEKVELLGVQLKNAFIDEETSSRDFSEKFFKLKQKREKTTNHTPIKQLSIRKSPRLKRESPVTSKLKRTPSTKALEAKIQPEPSMFHQKITSRRTLFDSQHEKGQSTSHSPRKRTTIKNPSETMMLKKYASGSPLKRIPSKTESMIEARVTKPSPRKKLAQPQKQIKTKIRVQRVKKEIDLDDKARMKLRDAVMTAFESRNIGIHNPIFKACFRRLFNICKEYAKDFQKKAGMNDKLKALANAHVDQVIDWEKKSVTSK